MVDEKCMSAAVRERDDRMNPADSHGVNNFAITLNALRVE